MMFVEKDIVIAPRDSGQKVYFPSEDSLLQDFSSEAKAHALRVSPEESCGLIVEKKYWECRNAADNPEKDFIIDPKDYMKARSKGKLQAIVHSHPEGGGASELDILACKRTKIPWYIYSIPNDKWSIINP